MVKSGAARTKVNANGRIAIPARLRRELGLRAGDEVLMRIEAGELRVCTLAAALQRIRREAAPYLAPDISLSEELIADRRAEAAREQATAPQLREARARRAGRR